jgi:hypothetical protein
MQSFQRFTGEEKNTLMVLGLGDGGYSFFDSTTPGSGFIHYNVLGLEDTLADANVDDVQIWVGFVTVLAQRNEHSNSWVH